LLNALRGELGALDLRWLLAAGLARLLPAHCFSRTRTYLYRLGGLAIGPGSVCFGPITLWGSPGYASLLSIGANCRLNAPLHFELTAPIRIGNSVGIGWGTKFITANHDDGGPGNRAGETVSSPIVIEDGCWIAASVVLLPGVTLGAGCIVSAGSVVSASVAPGKLVGGNPARPIKTLPEHV